MGATTLRMTTHVVTTFSIIIHNMATLCTVTFSITTHGITTLNKATFMIAETIFI